MKKLLSIWNAQRKSQKLDKKSEKKAMTLRSRMFEILFRCIEAIWILMQIIQYVLQIFK